MGLLELFYIFFTIGLFSIGGGYAIIPLIQNQVVTKYGWITQQVFTDIITISQMTPGPLAVNTSTFVGMQLYGILGAIVATIGCVISGVVISTLLYNFFRKHRNSIYVFEILKGLKASSLGLIMASVVTIVLTAFTGSATFTKGLTLDWIAIAIFVLALFVLRKFKLNPILVIIASGIIGIFVYM